MCPEKAPQHRLIHKSGGTRLHLRFAQMIVVLRQPFAVPDKIFELTLILDFIDRCTQNALLHLPLAAQSVLTQSRSPALLAGDHSVRVSHKQIHP